MSHFFEFPVQPDMSQRYTVRKNTIPYVQPYAVIDTATNAVVGHYKSEKLAQKAARYIEHFGVPRGFTPKKTGNDQDARSVFDAFDQRLKKPDGDPFPETRPQPKRRRIQLD